MKDQLSHDTNERSQGRPGGSIAVYGNETLRTIKEVSWINRTGPDGGGNSSSYYSHSNKKPNDGFAGVLADEQKKNHEPQTISLKSVSYTRQGTPTSIFMMLRDYTFQN